MKPSQWPHQLDGIYAKSVDRGGDTLAEHTWDVLSQLARLRHLRPTLPTLAQTPQMWHLLFWTCLFHDFGKAASGFQAMLASKGDQRWKHRHEVLSLACFDWIAPSLNADDQRAVVAAIVSHHRDAKAIRELYDLVDEDFDPLKTPLDELDLGTASQMWHWVNDCAVPWAQALGFAPGEVQPLPLMPHDAAMGRLQREGVQRVRFWLDRYHQWVADLRHQPMTQVVLPILLRGLTTTSDHLASSNLRLNLALPAESWEHLAARILDEGKHPYVHQGASAARAGRSALLVSPTGSGKTEAALYWALGDGTRPVARIFYALPYQASMNAMRKRLEHTAKGFGSEAVGLQHGRALQAMYLSFADQASTPKSAEARARREKNINTLHARPIKVLSPYQMLKAAFQLRGFEGMLTDYAQAAFIFDEIHAYDPDRLALMLEMMRFLRQHFQSRFFVMSATFPALIRERLTDALALEKEDVISANTALFQQFRRHRLHLLDGELLTDGVVPIMRDVQSGKTVLACVNTVKGAQQLCDALHREGLPPEQIVLIHSRYTMLDRIVREEMIMTRCGLEVKEPTPFVLVATQVVEVSLNIDLDTIYSEPAPLESLLQRFGRVNRLRTKGICPVHVFRTPLDGQGVYGRHSDPEKRGHIIRVTLAELERHNDEEIDEAQIAGWLDTIYADPQLHAEWTQAYQRMATNAATILENLRPFDSDPQTEEQFEQLFDAIEVLPKIFETHYVDLVMKGDFLEASQYLVSISTQKYQQFRRKGLVKPIAGLDDQRNRYMVMLPYSSTLGLQFEEQSGDFDWL